MVGKFILKKLFRLGMGISKIEAPGPVTYEGYTAGKLRVILNFFKNPESTILHWLPG